MGKSSTVTPKLAPTARQIYFHAINILLYLNNHFFLSTPRRYRILPAPGVNYENGYVLRFIQMYHFVLFVGFEFWLIFTFVGVHDRAPSGSSTLLSNAPLDGAAERLAKDKQNIDKKIHLFSPKLIFAAGKNV